MWLMYTTRTNDDWAAENCCCSSKGAITPHLRPTNLPRAHFNKKQNKNDNLTGWNTDTLVIKKQKSIILVKRDSLAGRRSDVLAPGGQTKKEQLQNRQNKTEQMLKITKIKDQSPSFILAGLVMKCKQKRAEEALFGRGKPTMKLFRLEEPQDFVFLPLGGKLLTVQMWLRAWCILYIGSLQEPWTRQQSGVDDRNTEKRMKSRWTCLKSRVGSFSLPASTLVLSKDLTLDQRLDVNNQQLRHGQQKKEAVERRGQHLPGLTPEPHRAEDTPACLV